ncbi:MAG TPA: SDR family oxidoreductase [Candidatus Binatia bacterium]|nr:SDR family oxidoreductase [Candidatus Binatia bacterium]
MLEELYFDGAPVIVTGAGSGIGRAACEAFGELGATLVLVGRTLEALQQTAERLKKSGATSVAFVADVTNEEDVAKLRDFVAARWDHAKALVNNAGNNFRSSVDELTTEKWRELLSVNLDGTFFMSRAFLPLLLKAEGGAAIVNVASIFGVIGPAGFAAYAAAKGGVISLTRQMAIDYGPRGVRVNAISPGPILTDRVAGYYKGREQDLELTASAVALGRFGTPREIGNTIAFMASDASSYMNGANVVVDGGRTIK